MKKVVEKKSSVKSTPKLHCIVGGRRTTNPVVMEEVRTDRAVGESMVEHLTETAIIALRAIPESVRVECARNFGESVKLMIEALEDKSQQEQTRRALGGQLHVIEMAKTLRLVHALNESAAMTQAKVKKPVAIWSEDLDGSYYRFANGKREKISTVPRLVRDLLVVDIVRNPARRNEMFASIVNRAASEGKAIISC